MRELREAWHKVNAGDYSGSMACSRKALELLRVLSPASTPIPPDRKDRERLQRSHQVIDKLFELASAPAHADGATKSYQPERADAVALAGATAAFAQFVFALLGRVRTARYMTTESWRKIHDG